MKSLKPENKLLLWEFSIDYFAGVIAGIFPEDEPIIYGAIVKDHKA
jgi:hypothetical protein